MSRSPSRLIKILVIRVGVCAAFGLTVSKIHKNGDDAHARVAYSCADVAKHGNGPGAYSNDTVTEHAEERGRHQQVPYSSPHQQLTASEKNSKKLYGSPSASLEIRLRMPKDEVLEMMPHGCVTWFSNANHYDKLRTQHHRFLPHHIGFRRENKK